MRTAKIAALSAVVLIFALFCCLGNTPAFGVETELPISAADEEVRLPILMYHSILNSRKGRYIVSQKQLENDIAAITGAGYTFVSADEVIAYAEGRGTLPEKPIMITFDDGHYNNMYYGLPILEKYGVKVLFNVIGRFSENSSTNGDDSNPNYSHLTWEQVGELFRTGLVTFGSHTWNMHNYKPRFGIAQKWGESDSEYENALIEDAARLNDKYMEYTGARTEVFAYPFGKYSKEAREILENEGYKMFLTCNEGVSKVKRGDASTIKQLKRFNRDGSYSTADLLKRIAPVAQ